MFVAKANPAYTTAYKSQPETIKRLRPKRSERSPPNNELNTFVPWCAAQSNGTIASETPASIARNIKKLSEEFESVKRASTRRKRLKLLSNPRNESFGISDPRCTGTGDSRMKKIATSTASNAGIEATRNIRENSAAVGNPRFATKRTTSR